MRLAPGLVAVPSALAAAAGTVILVAALGSRRPMIAVARPARPALEFFLAAGLIRLAVVDSLRGLMTVAAIMAIRQIIGRGVRAIESQATASRCRRTIDPAGISGS